MDMVYFNTMMDHIIRDNGERIKCMGKGSFIIQIRRLRMMVAFMKMIFMEKESSITKSKVKRTLLLMLAT